MSLAPADEVLEDRWRSDRECVSKKNEIKGPQHEQTPFGVRLATVGRSAALDAGTIFT
jgi:hypothetical protein